MVSIQNILFIILLIMMLIVAILTLLRVPIFNSTKKKKVIKNHFIKGESITITITSNSNTSLIYTPYFLKESEQKKYRLTTKEKDIEINQEYLIEPLQELQLS